MRPRTRFLTAFILAISCLAVLAQYDPTPPVPAVSATPGEPQTSIEDYVVPPTPLRQPIAMRVVGSNVKNLIGEYLGRVENVVVNGENGMTEFAMLLVNYPTNTTRYTPVPWGSLSYVWDQSQVGGVPGALQVFLLNVDKATLERAPSLDRSEWAALRDPSFPQRIAAFFGPSDTSAVGAPGAASGVVAGGAAGGVVPSAVTSVPGATTTPGFSGGSGGFPVIGGGGFILPPGAVLVTESNFLGGTNFVITTNVILTNMVADGIQTNVVINLTNFPAPSTLTQNTNPLFAQETNFFQGGTNLFRPTNLLVPNRPITAPTNTAIGLPTGRPAQQRPFSPIVAPTNVAPGGTVAPATGPAQQAPAPTPVAPQQQQQQQQPATPQQTRPAAPTPTPAGGGTPRG